MWCSNVASPHNCAIVQTDFVLVVCVTSTAACEQFTREAIVGLENVTRFTSYEVLYEVSVGLALKMT
jgi:DNA-binding Lrp family transcriptional regulator